MADIHREMRNFEKEIIKIEKMIEGRGGVWSQDEYSQLLDKFSRMNEKRASIGSGLTPEEGRKCAEWFIEQAQKLSDFKPPEKRCYVFNAKNGFAVAVIIKNADGKFHLYETQKAKLQGIHNQYDELDSAMNEAAAIVKRYEQGQG